MPDENNTSYEAILENSLGQQCLLAADGGKSISIDFRYLIYGPTLFCVILLGVFGNMLVFIGFYKRIWIVKRNQQGRSRSLATPRMHRYLAVLSLWDLVLLIGSFFLYNLPYLMYGSVRMYGSYVKVYPYAYALACASRTGGIWILIASTVDRYFAVCHPFAHHIYSTTKLTNLVLLSCCALSFVYGWPRYYHIIIEDCFDLVSEEWTLVAVGSDLRSNPVYWYGYKIAADFLLVSVGPFVILLYLSLAICLAVRRSSPHQIPPKSQNQHVTRFEHRYTPCQTVRNGSRRISEDYESVMMNYGRSTNPSTPIRRHEGSKRRRFSQETQNSLNFMLISVLVKFLICHSLPAVLDVCETTMDPRKFQTPVMDDVVHTANALVILNGSLNFVLYLVCSPRFRRGVLRSLTCGLSKALLRRTTTSSSQECTRTVMYLTSIDSVK